jgi:hypothetical protein
MAAVKLHKKSARLKAAAFFNEKLTIKRRKLVFHYPFSDGKLSYTGNHVRFTTCFRLCLHFKILGLQTDTISLLAQTALCDMVKILWGGQLNREE